MARMAGLHSALSRAALLFIVSGLLLLTLPAGVRAQTTGGPTVDIVQVGGFVDATVVDYLQGALEDAAADDVEVVVVELDSTGLLNVNLDEALAPLLDRDVPVAVWVGPPGARATGGAAWLAAAADVLAVAPGTIVGAAAGTASAPPGGADPSDVDEASSARAIRERLEQRGLWDDAVVATTQPDTPLPADAELPPGVAPDEVRVESDREIVDAGRVDVVAATLQEALAALDGRTVRIDGAERVLDVDPVTANVRFVNQGLWGRVLHSVANPTLAYLLVVAGLMAIAFEFFQPGFGVAGLSGVLTAGLGLYGLTVLPTRPLMAALITAGVALLAVDLAMAGLGIVTVAGTAALAAGSIWLYTSGMSVPGWVIAGVVVFAVVFFVVIMTTVLRAQGGQARAGVARVTGKHGVVRSMLNPEGHVFVDGALWRARAPEAVGRVRTGTPVKVVGTRDGLTLDVELVDDSDRAPVA